MKGAGACPVSVTLAFEAGDEHLCPAFALRLVRGVRNGASPAWMQRRLAAIGLRPINALVDITNYVTFDRGRPLHVFDAAKVKGDLTVRRARNGEEIARPRRHVPTRSTSRSSSSPTRTASESIAGIMGGEHSGCDATTTDVLIESALWDPLNIAQSGPQARHQSPTRATASSAASIRPSRVPGLDLATRMVLELCGGEASERLARRRDPPAHGRDHRFPVDRGAAPLRPRRAAPGIEGRSSRASASTSRAPATA